MNNCQGATTKYEKEKKYRKKGQMHCLHIYGWRYAALFDNKNAIFGMALGASGAFDKNGKTDTAAAFGIALGASIGSGQEWTLEDSLKLGATISVLDSMKEDS